MDLELDIQAKVRVELVFVDCLHLNYEAVRNIYVQN